MKYFVLFLLGFVMISCGTTEQTTNSGSSNTVLLNAQHNQADTENQELIDDATYWADINCKAKMAQIEARKNPKSTHHQQTATALMQQRDKAMAKIRTKYEGDPILKEEFQKAVGEARKTLSSCMQIDARKK